MFCRPTAPPPAEAGVTRAGAARRRVAADLWAYEQTVNTDQVWNESALAIESNPFDVVALEGGRALVADAAGNDILIVEADGTMTGSP